MSYKKTKTRFTKLIRIDPEVYKWIVENKDTRTNAGYLDKVVRKHIAIEKERELRKQKKPNKIRNKPCTYCNSPSKGTIDHIIPKSRGGKNHPNNYQPLCEFCNSNKGNKTETELLAIFTDLRERGVWYEWEEPFMSWLNWLEIKRKERKAPNHFLFNDKFSRN